MLRTIPDGSMIMTSNCEKYKIMSKEQLY